MTRYSIDANSLPLGVAVSGGADSVVLLTVLKELQPRFHWPLAIVHVNHALRGRESDEDQEFVSDLARDLDLPLHLVRQPIEKAGDLEQKARVARRQFYLELIRSGTVQRVALGHSRSDQAETVLLRLFRGSGLTGLAAMREATHDGLLRPLLSFSRQQIREWAAARGLRWREDSSNADSYFRRNHLRNELLPQIRAVYNPNVERKIVQFADTAQAEESFWQEFVSQKAEGTLERHGTTVYCRLSSFRKFGLAVKRRMLRHAFSLAKGDLRGLDASHVEQALRISESSQGHDRVLLPGLDLLRSYDVLRMGAAQRTELKRHYRFPVTTGMCLALPFQVGTICIIPALSPDNRELCDTFLDEKDRSKFVTVNQVGFCGPDVLNRLVIRNWEPGDRMFVEGHGTGVKIKELFQQQRVLLWDRRHWPVMELDGEVVWAKKFGTSLPFVNGSKNPLSASIYYLPDPEAFVS